MSLINTLTKGLIYKDGEEPAGRSGGRGWNKDKNSQYWVSCQLRDIIHVYIPMFIVWVFSLFTIGGKKVIGRALGFGECANCHMPWKYVKGQDIKYSDSGGMFPICVKCFEILSPPEIDSYIEALVHRWAKDSIRLGYEWGKDQTPEEVIASAQQQVRAMKLE